MMVDAARQPSSLSHYHRLIDFSADWGLNTLLFRLCDDQGCAVRFASRPGLVTHEHALTRPQVGELVAHARECGIEMIPEIESFGHTRYITDAATYAAMSDRDPADPEFNGLCPVHPQTLKLLSDLFEEAAEMFPGRYLHGGCDEVNWGGSALSRDALRHKTRQQIWSGYLNALNDIARKLHRDWIIWADHVLRKDPDILLGLDKSIILMDWDYWNDDPAAIRSYAQRAIESGHRIVGSPALNWCKWGPRNGTAQLRNIDAFVNAYQDIESPRCLGIIVTNWTPTRYLPGTIWDGMAYAATAMREGCGAAHEEAFARFVQKHYAATWDRLWADVFQSLYDFAPSGWGCGQIWLRPRLPIPWHDEASLIAALQAGRQVDPPYNRLLSQLIQCRPMVRQHHDDFDSLVASVEYMENLFWRESAIVAAGTEADEAALHRVIVTIARRDQKVLDMLRAHWDLDRPSSGEGRQSSITNMREPDQLIPTMLKATTYSASLANRPAEFAGLVKRSV
jgi:hypothetical protein